MSRQAYLRAWAAAWLLCAAAPASARGVPHVEPAAQSRLTAHWRRPVVRVGADRQMIDNLATPAVVDVHFVRAGKAPPLVVVGTGEGSVLAVHQDSGALVWRYRHPVAIDGTVTLLSQAELGLGDGVAPAVAVVCGRDGVLVALQLSSGAPLWQSQLDAPSRAAVIGERGRLYVTTDASQIVALDGRSGRLLWTQGRAAPAGLALLGHGRPALAGGRVVASFADGFVMAVDAQDGRMLWERPLSLQGGRFVDADADPVVYGSHVFVASITDGLFALDLAEGQTVWQQPLAEILSQTLVPGPEPLLVVGDVFGKVRALRPRDGRRAWQLDAGAGPITSLTPFAGGVAFLAGVHGLIWADAHDGRPLSTQGLGGLPGGNLGVAGSQLAHLGRGGNLLLWQAQAAADGRAVAP